MRDEWIHVGRLWTNGEQFLAIDSAGRGDWRGDSDEEFDRTLELTPEETGLSVGMRMAVLVGGDGVVRDDNWIGVFQSESGALAFVQASGAPAENLIRAVHAACSYSWRIPPRRSRRRMSRRARMSGLTACTGDGCIGRAFAMP